MGPAWVRDWGWKTREKKKNTARNNSLSLSKKTKKKRKNVERNKKRRKTPQYNRNIQNFQKSRITIKLLNVNDKIGERKFEGYKKKKGMGRFLYISFTFFNYSRRIILLSHIYFLYLRLFICLPSASILRQRSKSLVGLL